LGVPSTERPAQPPRLRRDLRLPEARLPVCMAVDQAGNTLAWNENRRIVRAPVSDLRVSAQRSIKEVHGLHFTPGGRLWLTDCHHIRYWQGESLRCAVWNNALAEVVSGLSTLRALAAGR